MDHILPIYKFIINAAKTLDGLLKAKIKSLKSSNPHGMWLTQIVVHLLEKKSFWKVLDWTKSTHYSTSDKTEDATSFQIKLKHPGSGMAAVRS